MDENSWIKIGLAISGILTGIIAGRFQLGRAMNGQLRTGLFTLVQFEQEVNNILHIMRQDMDSGFQKMEDQHAEMLRRLRKQEDMLSRLELRVERLEAK